VELIENICVNPGLLGVIQMVAILLCVIPRSMQSLPYSLNLKRMRESTNVAYGAYLKQIVFHLGNGVGIKNE